MARACCISFLVTLRVLFGGWCWTGLWSKTRFRSWISCLSTPKCGRDLESGVCPCVWCWCFCLPLYRCFRPLSLGHAVSGFCVSAWVLVWVLSEWAEILRVLSYMQSLFACVCCGGWSQRRSCFWWVLRCLALCVLSSFTRGGWWRLEFFEESAWGSEDCHCPDCPNVKEHATGFQVREGLVRSFVWFPGCCCYGA